MEWQTSAMSAERYHSINLGYKIYQTKPKLKLFLPELLKRYSMLEGSKGSVLGIDPAKKKVSR